MAVAELPPPPRSARGDGRVPPHNLEAEESLLGAMLLSRDAIVAATELGLDADEFYKPAHGHVYDAICSLYSAGEPADPVTVAEELRRAGLLDAIGGPAVLVTLQAGTPATSNAGRYARIISEHALLRRLISVAGEIAELGYGLPDDVVAAVDRAESMVFEVAERRVTDSTKRIRDLLDDSLTRLEMLYEKGDSITGVPTGYHDLDELLSGLQPSTLNIVGARPATGKCVAHDTLLVDPATGERLSIAEVHARGTGGDPVEVLTLDDDRQLARRRPSAFVDDGVRPVYRVRTLLGREVRTTAAHPFLTPNGWRPLRELEVGTRVAVPRHLPVFGSEPLPDEDVVLLAHLAGDAGSTRASARFTTVSSKVLADVERHAERLGARVVVETERGVPSPTCRLVTDRARPNLLTDRLRQHGLLGRAAPDKLVPPAVFRLPREQVALFLNRLFATGGTAHVRATGAPVVAYCTVSRRLAADVAHLLLRFGINARVRRRTVAYRGARCPAHELAITAPDELRRFVDEIGIYGKEGAVADVRRALGPEGAGAPAPVEAALAAAGAPARAARRASPRFADPRAWPQSSVHWDEIVAIEPDGEAQVYDLTVPGEHNFVADDVFVHNTAFALGLAAHAALEANRPVLLFSLEMSHLEITQRLLSAEARVDSSRMRNGKLAEADWNKISFAIGRLAEAPIYIDDNPQATVMEIRAKARRLKSRLGDLGVVVVDYLQLMTGRTSAENRQVEVSEISRGLKILARELETPVVALSQLSRQLEMRADKRPMLADLRESGSLEQDADVVMFLYRDELYNPESPDRGTAEVLVSKHRSGPTGMVRLAFLDHYTRFANMAKGV